MDFVEREQHLALLQHIVGCLPEVTLFPYVGPYLGQQLQAVQALKDVAFDDQCLLEEIHALQALAVGWWPACRQFFLLFFMGRLAPADLIGFLAQLFLCGSSALLQRLQVLFGNPLCRQDLGHQCLHFLSLDDEGTFFAA